MTTSQGMFYVQDFLDNLQTRVSKYGAQALRVQIDPRGDLDEADADLLR